jgi:hypothetical protein
LLGKVIKVGKSVGSAAVTSENAIAKPIARILPGGQNDLKAENAQIDQNMKTMRMANDMINSGDARKIATGKKLLASNKKDQEATSKQVSDTAKEIKDTTDRKHIALGAAGTAADILTAGTYGAAVRGAKAGRVIKGAEIAANEAKADKAYSLLSKTKKAVDTSKSVGGQLAMNATAGGLNAAAGGGDAKEIEKNALIGALVPEALHVGGSAAAKGITKVAGSDTVKTIADKTKLDRVPALMGKDKNLNEFVSNQKTNSLLSRMHGGEPIDANTEKSLHSVMAGVHTPKAEVEAAAAKDVADKAAAKTAAQDAEKATTETKKIDQQLEVYTAKKADKGGELTNVDQVKIKQLQERRAELNPQAEAPVAAAAPAAGGVPTIKAYGREIQLSKENGYKAIDTPNGTIYQKPQRYGTNASGASLHNNWYDAKGNKLTEEQAQAALKASGGSRPFADLQKQIEDAHNAGNTELATQLEAKLPDQGMNPDAPAMTAERRASLMAKMKKGSTEGSMPKTAAAAPKVPPDAEAGTRTLRPSETAHMPEIGGYSHSEHMAQEYADMLRGQEQSVKGGQMIPDGEGGYKRISEHSKFYRDFYKENGKAPTKADYLEQAKKELEAHKDGMGAGDDYKKLLEREAKPVERVKVESTVKDVPQGTSKVAKRIEKDLHEQYGDLAQYDRISIADQAKKAEALISDREQLNKVISGEAPLPDGLRATSIIAAVRNNPELLKDTDLLKRLASSPLASESSYSAQELRIAAENAKHDPITAIRQLKEAREKAFERKNSGQTAVKAVNDEVRQIQAAKPKVTKETWGSFVDSLKC